MNLFNLRNVPSHYINSMETINHIMTFVYGEKCITVSMQVVIASDENITRPDAGEYGSVTESSRQLTRV